MGANRTLTSRWDARPDGTVRLVWTPVRHGIRTESTGDETGVRRVIVHAATAEPQLATKHSLVA